MRERVPRKVKVLQHGDMQKAVHLRRVLESAGDERPRRPATCIAQSGAMVLQCCLQPQILGSGCRVFVTRW